MIDKDFLHELRLLYSDNQTQWVKYLQRFIKELSERSIKRTAMEPIISIQIKEYPNLNLWLSSDPLSKPEYKSIIEVNGIALIKVPCSLQDFHETVYEIFHAKPNRDQMFGLCSLLIGKTLIQKDEDQKLRQMAQNQKGN